MINLSLTVHLLPFHRRLGVGRSVHLILYRGAVARRRCMAPFLLHLVGFSPWSERSSSSRRDGSASRRYRCMCMPPSASGSAFPCLPFETLDVESSTRGLLPLHAVVSRSSALSQRRTRGLRRNLDILCLAVADAARKSPARSPVRERAHPRPARLASLAPLTFPIAAGVSGGVSVHFLPTWCSPLLLATQQSASSCQVALKSCGNRRRNGFAQVLAWQNRVGPLRCSTTWSLAESKRTHAGLLPNCLENAAIWRESIGQSK